MLPSLCLLERKQSCSALHYAVSLSTADFADMLLRMDLATEVVGDLQFKDLRSRYGACIPADFAMMVMLRRPEYSCRFADLVCEFGKATTYIYMRGFPLCN